MEHRDSAPGPDGPAPLTPSDHVPGAFYWVCGAAAGLINSVADPDSTTPVIGASGAISGMLGAYIVLYPKANVVIWAGAWFVFRVPAWAVLGLWFLLQIVNLGGGESNVAWWAHIGGMVVGMALIGLLEYRHVGLFGSGHLDQTRPPGAAR